MPSRYSLEYSEYKEPVVRIRPSPRAFSFSKGEAVDLLIATALVALVYLSLYRWFIFVPTILLSVFTAFVLHEIAHKYVAQSLGFGARFRLDRTGLLLTAVSIILPIKVIAPGYVSVIPLFASYDRGKIGKIAVAGPLTNLILALIFISLVRTNVLLYLAARINIDVAIFNLIPFGVLDGRKVLDWDTRIWATVFIITVLAWFFIVFFA